MEAQYKYVKWMLFSTRKDADYKKYNRLWFCIGVVRNGYLRIKVLFPGWGKWDFTSKIIIYIYKIHSYKYFIPDLFLSNFHQEKPLSYVVLSVID